MTTGSELANPATLNSNILVLEAGRLAASQPQFYRTKPFNINSFGVYRFPIQPPLSAPNPWAVFVQVRSPNNSNPTYGDSFVVTVNEIFREFISLKILRVDSSSNPAAQIELNVLIVE